MRLRWTAGALRDLENIVDHLFDQTPQHAPRLVRSIYEAVAALRTFPSRERAGKKAGTRELVMASLPYVVVYQVAGDLVHVVRILHGAQQWPE
jgi:addiction module RelE/StbE family toxin